MPPQKRSQTDVTDKATGQIIMSHRVYLSVICHCHGGSLDLQKFEEFWGGEGVVWGESGVGG